MTSDRRTENVASSYFSGVSARGYLSYDQTRRRSPLDIEEYFLVGYPEDRAVVKRLRALSVRLLRLFDETYVDEYCWPYWLRDNEEIEASVKISLSTTAMVLHAIAVSTGRIRSSVLVPAVKTWRPIDEPEGIPEKVKAAAERLARECGDPPAPLTLSSTWGDDDPLTLVWLYEVAINGLMKDTETSDRIKETAKKRIAQAFLHPEQAVLQRGSIKGRSLAIPHVFPMLRLLQLHSALNAEGSVETSSLERWLLEQLHLQLSYSGIRDSDFDAAQLIFSLEALLIINADAVDRLLAERVVEVLHSLRSPNPYWRPIKPLTINAQGLILLPQSVEVANSLLRICGLLDRHDAGVSWFGANHDLLQSYSDWLESKSVKGSVRDGIAFEGWQSEHTHAEGIVHLWATSQVLLFFQHYGAMLQDQIARVLRTYAGITPAPIELVVPERRKTEWAKKRLRRSRSLVLTVVPSIESILALGKIC